MDQISNNQVSAREYSLAKYAPVPDLSEIRRRPDLYPRVGATPYTEACSKMYPIVYGAVLYRGQAMSEESMKFIASALVMEIQADTELGLQYLSWWEVGMAVRRAVLGCGPELYGISVSSLYSALVNYAKGAGHEASKNAL